jgi:hypothetical protein
MHAYSLASMQLCIHTALRLLLYSLTHAQLCKLSYYVQVLVLYTV